MDRTKQHRSSPSPATEPGEGVPRLLRALWRMRVLLAPLVAIVFTLLLVGLSITPAHAAAGMGWQQQGGGHNGLELQARFPGAAGGQDVGRTGQQPLAPPPPNPAGDKINTALTNMSSILVAFVGGVTVIMVVVGGYSLATSEGNPRRREFAYGTLAGAAIGAIIVLLSSDITSSFIHAIP